MAVLGERRVVGNLIFQTQTSEPAVDQIQIRFFAKASLRAIAEAVADDQHANFGFGTV